MAVMHMFLPGTKQQKCVRPSRVREQAECGILRDIKSEGKATAE